MTTQSLAFQDTQFDIIDQRQKPWLRGYQIGSALGYTQPDAAVAKLYDRNSDEFTGSMTAIVELDTAGGKQKVRIFSLRGAHLLAMLSRTKIAKAFRKWVLDILEGIAEIPAKTKRQPKALPGGMTHEQQDAIKGMVKARVEVLPKDKQAKGAITCWSALKSKFGCTYKDIAPEQFVDAVSLIARLPLEGEFLGRMELPAPAQAVAPAPQPIRSMPMTDSDCNNLLCSLKHAQFAEQEIVRMNVALEALRSPLVGTLRERIGVIRRHLEGFAKDAGLMAF